MASGKSVKRLVLFTAAFWPIVQYLLRRPVLRPKALAYGKSMRLH
jgi:hypothetical protein